jgi:riboflavin transporter FmnP
MENLKKSEEKKCTKCDKMKQSIVPQVIVGVLVFGFTVYGFVEFVRDVIELFSH